MATSKIKPPPGFELEDDVSKSLPEGFELETGTPTPPEGFELETGDPSESMPPGFQYEDEGTQFGFGDQDIISKLNPIERSAMVAAARTGDIASTVPALAYAAGRYSVNKTADIFDRIYKGEFSALGEVGGIQREILGPVKGESFIEQGIPEWLLDNPVRNQLQEAQMSFSYLNERYPNETATSLFSKGQYGEMTDWLLHQTIENAPYMIMTTAFALMGATPAMLSSAAIYGASAKLGQLAESEEAKKLSTDEQFRISLMSGLAEAIPEVLGGKAIQYSAKLFKSIGVKAGSQVLESSLWKAITDSAKAIGINVAGEGLEEGVTGAVQGEIDMYYELEDGLTYKKVANRMVNAMMIGGFAGGLISTPGAIGKGILDASKVNKEAGVDLRPERQELTEIKATLEIQNQGYSDPNTEDTIITPGSLDAEEVELAQVVDEKLETKDYKDPGEENLDYLGNALGGKIEREIEKDIFEEDIREKLAAPKAERKPVAMPSGFIPVKQAMRLLRDQGFSKEEISQILSDAKEIESIGVTGFDGAELLDIADEVRYQSVSRETLTPEQEAYQKYKGRQVEDIKGTPVDKLGQLTDEELQIWYEENEPTDLKSDENILKAKKIHSALLGSGDIESAENLREEIDSNSDVAKTTKLAMEEAEKEFVPEEKVVSKEEKSQVRMQELFGELEAMEEAEVGQIKPEEYRKKVEDIVTEIQVLRERARPEKKRKAPAFVKEKKGIRDSDIDAINNEAVSKQSDKAFDVAWKRTLKKAERETLTKEVNEDKIKKEFKKEWDGKKIDETIGEKIVRWIKTAVANLKKKLTTKAGFARIGKGKAKQIIRKKTGLVRPEKLIVQTEKVALKKQFRDQARAAGKAFLAGARETKSKMSKKRKDEIQKEKFIRMIKRMPIQGMHVQEKKRINQLKGELKDKKTLDEIRDLYEEIWLIKEYGKQKHQMLWQYRIAKREAEVEQLISNVLGKKELSGKPYLKSTLKESPTKILEGLHASVLSPVRVMDKLDDGGGTFTGEHNEYLYNRVDEAYNTYLASLDRLTDGIDSIMKKHDIDVNTLSREFTIKGKKVQTDEIMGFYLQVQNKKNKAALTAKAGNDLSEEFLNEAISKLTLTQKKFIDEMYEFIFSQKEFNRTNQAIINYSDGKEEMEKVAGKYLPMYRQNPIKDQAIDKEILDAFASREGLKKAYTKKGFGKKRIEISEEYQTPIKTGFMNLVFDHIQRREYFISTANVVKDVQYLVNHPKWKRAVAQEHGRETVRVLQDWANTVANPSAIYRQYSSVDKFIATVRRHSAIVYLGLNVITMAKQFPSISFYAGEGIGPLELSEAAQYLTTDWVNQIEMIHKLSPQMKHRSIERELDKVRDFDKGKYDRAVRKYGRASMEGIRFIDMLVTHSGWLAKFNTLRKTGEYSVHRAAREADRMIFRTQPISTPKDVANIYTKGEMLNSILVFTKQLNQIFGMVTYDIPARFKGGQKGRALAGGMGVALAASMIWAISHGRLPRDEEDAKEMLKEQVGIIPLIGAPLKSYMTGFQDNSLLIIKPLVAAVSAINYGYQGKWMRSGEKTAELGAWATPYPFSQPRRTIKGMIDIAKDPTVSKKRLIYSDYALYGKYAKSEIFKAMESKDRSKYKRYKTLSKEVKKQSKAIKENPAQFPSQLRAITTLKKTKINKINKLIRRYNKTPSKTAMTTIVRLIESFLKES